MRYLNVTWNIDWWKKHHNGYNGNQREKIWDILMESSTLAYLLWKEWIAPGLGWCKFSAEFLAKRNEKSAYLYAAAEAL